jgi:hypothetical protein
MFLVSDPPGVWRRGQKLPGINHTASGATEIAALSLGWIVMKVIGTGGVGQAGGSAKARPAGGAGFRLPGVGQASGPTQVSGASGVTGVFGVEALLAMQDVGGPLERRRKAVRRATGLLDVLDDIKIALLDGDLGPADLDRLGRALREERGGTDDPALEAVLDEIELRAAVEMAKLDQARRAA